MIIDDILNPGHAVVTAALIAVVGVVVTNVVTARNHSRQLQHDRDERARERQLSIRKGLYLDAAAGLANCIDAVMWYADLNLEHQEIHARLDLARTALPKVHLVAQPALVKAIIESTRSISEAHLKMRLARVPLQSLQAEMKRHTALATRHTAKAEEMFDKIIEVSIGPQWTSQQLQALQLLANKVAEEGKRHYEKAGEIRAELRRRAIDLVLTASGLQQGLRRHALDVIEATRKELGESIDMNVYTQLLSEPQSLQRRDLATLYGVSTEEEQPSLSEDLNAPAKDR